MRDYVEISITGNIAGAKKFDVYELDTPIPMPDVPNEWAITLNGTTVQSFGPQKLYWKFSTMVFYNDQRAGYATITDVYNLFSYTGTSPILLRDWRYDTIATTYNVLHTNKGDFKEAVKLVSATLDANSSLFKVGLELRQQ